MEHLEPRLPRFITVNPKPQAIDPKHTHMCCRRSQLGWPTNCCCENTHTHTCVAEYSTASGARRRGSQTTVRALITRIGFGGLMYHIYNRNHQNSIGIYWGPYIVRYKGVLHCSGYALRNLDRCSGAEVAVIAALLPQRRQWLPIVFRRVPCDGCKILYAKPIVREIVRAHMLSYCLTVVCGRLAQYGIQSLLSCWEYSLTNTGLGLKRCGPVQCYEVGQTGLLWKFSCRTMMHESYTRSWVAETSLSAPSVDIVPQNNPAWSCLWAARVL